MVNPSQTLEGLENVLSENGISAFEETWLAEIVNKGLITS